MAEIARRHPADPGKLRVILDAGLYRGQAAMVDVDLLVITCRDNWREHEPIRFLAARLSNEHDVFFSPRVMGLSQFEVLEKVQPLFYEISLTRELSC